MSAASRSAASRASWPRTTCVTYGGGRRWRTTPRRCTPWWTPRPISYACSVSGRGYRLWKAIGRERRMATIYERRVVTTPDGPRTGMVQRQDGPSALTVDPLAVQGQGVFLRMEDFHIALSRE